MDGILNSPILVFLLSFVAMSMATRFGDFLRRKIRPMKDEDREDYSLTTASTLTLLGLILGFSFSMAISRYDQRKNYEEAEANAIGTEYVRADLLPASDAATVRDLLKRYVEQRVLFYTTRFGEELNKIDRDTAHLQNELWNAVKVPTTASPTPVAALVTSGMNDVLNSQGYTQAAWSNRIPVAAWGLMVAIALFCNVLIGYGAHRTAQFLFEIMPLAVAISFFMIADIDSPRGGIIRVAPQNLLSLSHSLKAQ